MNQIDNIAMFAEEKHPNEDFPRHNIIVADDKKWLCYFYVTLRPYH